MRTVPEVHETFNDIESKFGLFDRTVAGVQYWERVRNDIYDNVCLSLGIFEEAGPELGSSWKDRFRGLYLLFRNVLVKNPYVTGDHDFLFYAHPRRKQRDDGTWFDLYTDPVLEGSNLDAVSVEYDHKLNHYTPPSTSLLRYTDFIEYLGTLYKMVSRYSIPETEVDYLKNAEQEFKEQFGVAVDLVGTVRDELAERQALLPLYDALLRRVDPEVAVLVVSYGKESFIEACQRRGVPVVELQHGSISKYHFGYSLPNNRQKVAFPDYFFTFGPFWRNRFDLPLDSENVYDVGYPYLEREADKVQDQEDIISDIGPQILFISQETIGAKLSKFAAETSELVGDEYSIIYKLHPDEYSTWETKYPWLINSPIEVRGPESDSLYELFAKADIQVGVYSTAVYEGLYFELDTYVVNTGGVHNIEDLINEGVVTSVSSPESFYVELKEGATAEYDPSRFFKSNSANNVKQKLRSILNQERDSE
ncbi:hypothetical protein PNP85_02110 [Halobacterium salinarum]|uniref:hypothetical protein n=1 Tax=Halobacterium TaxID=2239 RepID=UPI001F272044|nr:hypothetical protein [Halobacterium salinarum]MCF2165520.1 hypothetical protein [Halobacterium salinarum]MCF2168689.1 hypothetical protein [Halobacterium salinarum]MDL0124882.1 hypothetical protein [Halobacterium salinarum]MDL0138303.1 hypothetical protein [Halobacterium salinarum]